MGPRDVTDAEAALPAVERGEQVRSLPAAKVEKARPFAHPYSWSAFILIGLTVIARRRINWPEVAAQNRWLIILFLYMLVSILWSDYPFVSIKRWIKAGGTLAMALIVLQEKLPYPAAQLLSRKQEDGILRRGLTVRLRGSGAEWRRQVGN